jgi:hypothetical protein
MRSSFSTDSIAFSAISKGTALHFARAFSGVTRTRSVGVQAGSTGKVRQLY